MHEAFHATDREPGFLSHGGNAQRLGVIIADAFDDRSEATKFRITTGGDVKISGNAGEGNDVAVRSTHRGFVGAIPAEGSIAIRDGFQTIVNVRPGAKNGGVLLFVSCRQEGRENFLGGMSEHLIFGTQTGESEECVVDGKVFAVPIFHTEREVLRSFQQALHYFQPRGKGKQFPPHGFDGGTRFGGA